MQTSPHSDIDMWGRVWMSHFRKAWQSLNFYKEYLFGFETLNFTDLIYAQTACNIQKTKKNMKLHHMTSLKIWKYERTD